MKSLVQLASAMALSIAPASAALAQPSSASAALDAPRRTSVAFGNLDLGSPEGGRILIHRLQAAARSVCGPPPVSLLDLARSQAFDRCAARAVDEALATLKRPQLAAAGPQLR